MTSDDFINPTAVEGCKIEKCESVLKSKHVWVQCMYMRLTVTKQKYMSGD